MATEVLQKIGTQIRFTHSSYVNGADVGTDWTISGATDVDLTHNILGDTAGRQSAKADLGATFASSFAVFASFDLTGETPSQPGTVDYYWAPSTHTTPANGNVAGNSGVDAAAPDGAVGSPTLADFLLQCQYIGSLITHNGAAVQSGYVGIFRSPSRYGQLIVVNNTGAAHEATDTEGHVVFNPIVDEVQ